MKLHLGCGDRYLRGWLNIDLESRIADKKFDLTRPWPYASKTVTCIYAEHFIEHVLYAQLEKLLLECYRVLKPGGAIRLSTPDLAYLVHCYLNNNIIEWKDYDFMPDTACQMLNDGFTKWGHRYVYDERELMGMLSRAGFCDNERCGWKQSDYPEFFEIESRPYHHDLIVEGRKR